MKWDEMELTLRRKVGGRASKSCSENLPAGTPMMKASTLSSLLFLQMDAVEGRQWCPRPKSEGWHGAQRGGFVGGITW